MKKSFVFLALLCSCLSPSRHLQKPTAPKEDEDESEYNEEDLAIHEEYDFYLLHTNDGRTSGTGDASSPCEGCPTAPLVPVGALDKRLP